MENQYVEGEFTRYDALIAAEALQGDKQTRSLYTEVADQIDQLPKLEELETGFDDKGRSDPVSITYSGRVADVASCARKLTNDYPTVEAKVTGKKTTITNNKRNVA